VRILIAGGGTGGHLYPGIALAHEFARLRPGVEILFVGTARGLEARVVPREGFALATVRVRGIVGRGMVRAVAALARLPRARRGVDDRQAVSTGLIVGVGGYAADPRWWPTGSCAGPSCSWSRTWCRASPTGGSRRSPI
jgi:UDP-N-acetylglucosamine--N-acetylmuramyl-(pentapeptide) pyrophosphoryl-undecaprenol N-acetylglucosamine transferase